MSQAHRHAAPRSSSRRNAPKESWARRLVRRTSAKAQPAKAPVEAQPAESQAAETPVEVLPNAAPSPPAVKAKAGPRRARRTGWVSPEDLAEAPVLVSGEPVHLPGVFRLDGGRKSWLAGLDEVPRPAARLAEAPTAPAPALSFPPEPAAPDDAAADPDSHSIPQQARGARHARVRERRGPRDRRSVGAGP